MDRLISPTRSEAQSGVGCESISRCGVAACDHGQVSSSLDSDGFRHRRVALRRPPAEMIDDEDSIDLALVAELVNSGVLTAEISAANNHDPDLEV
jgi:hypothetical protein